MGFASTSARVQVPLASLEAGAVVVRMTLPAGARVDDDLTYHEAPRRSVPAAQPSLPL